MSISSSGPPEGVGVKFLFKGSVTPQQMQQYIAHQQQQSQGHNANSVSSPSVGSSPGANPYPQNFNAAAMVRSQTPAQGMMGMNANIQTPQGQSQMPPPPLQPSAPWFNINNPQHWDLTKQFQDETSWVDTISHHLRSYQTNGDPTRVDLTIRLSRAVSAQLGM